MPEPKQIDPVGIIDVGTLSTQSNVELTLMPSMAGGADSLLSKIRYPPIAKKAGIQGTVVVEFTVRAEGVAAGVEVVQGIGGGADEEVVRAIRRTVFYPAKLDGKVIDVRVRQPVHFSLAR